VLKDYVEKQQHVVEYIRHIHVAMVKVKQYHYRPGQALRVPGE
jgi:hypothetical protein